MCSRSIFVTSAIAGESVRNDRSLSSASTAIGAPRPGGRCSERAEPSTDHRRGIEPRHARARGRPSTSSWSCRAHPRSRCRSGRISSASISARGITGMRRRLASTSSGLEAPIAEEHHHHVGRADMPAQHRARCPPAPSCERRAVTSDPFASEPGHLMSRLRGAPRFRSCRCRRSRRSGSGASCRASGSNLTLPVRSSPPDRCLLRSMARQFQRPIGDDAGRVQARERARRPGHSLAPSGIAQEADDPFGQRRTGQIPLLDYFRRARVLQHLGVLALMVVCRGRQRDRTMALPRRSARRSSWRRGRRSDRRSSSRAPSRTRRARSARAHADIHRERAPGRVRRSDA